MTNTVKTRTAWTPGRSGNPGGRPKILKEVRKLAQANCAQAVRVLVKIMNSDEVEVKARIAAANAVLDRGVGKPTQALELSGKDGGPIKTLSHPGTLDELRAQALMLVEELGLAVPNAPQGAGSSTGVRSH